MTTLTDRPPAVASTPDPCAAPRRWRGVVLFIGLAGLYFAVGYLLVIRYDLLDGDAASRVANAGYVLMSRDPHLSAMGFVWNPLPSAVEIPILLFERWWPELRTRGLAGVIQSALFMAGAALIVRGIALDRGVGSGWRRVTVAAFALQPMIIVYGASGMSEAAFILCVLWCARYLMRWSDGREPLDLALAGLALGVGYTARYEVVPAAIGATVVVAVLAGRRAAAGTRRSTVVASVSILLLPITLAAGIWALTGWVINHELFAIVTSQYGNENQVAGALRRGDVVRDSPTALMVISARLLGMQPFVVIAAAGGLAYAALARKPAALVPVSTFGPVLVFAAWGQYSATTFGLFRYFLLAIPLVICVALVLWTPSGSPGPAWAVTTRAGRLGAATLCASIIIGFPVTVHAAQNDRIGNQQLRFIVNSLRHPESFPAQEQRYRQGLATDRLLADYFDRQRLPAGSVLMDSFAAWGIWLNSADTKQFNVTSDYDFKAALNRPWEFGVTYLVVSNPASTDADAINIRYPTLWNDGAGFSKLVLTMMNGASDDDRFRIFQVTGPPRTVLSPPS
jgi:hypothetical protein